MRPRYALRMMAATPFSDPRSARDAAYWEHIYRSSPAALDYDGWLDRVDLPSGAAVLDLGCGAGADTLALLRLGMRVTAADFSRSAVDLLRTSLSSAADLAPADLAQSAAIPPQAYPANRSLPCLVSADCFDMRQGLPYAGHSFDAVVADLSLHYFSWTDTAAIIADISRILRLGGRLIARVHSVRNLPPDAEAVLEKIEERCYRVDGFPRRYFTPEDIRSLLSGWQFVSLREAAICRYGLHKQVISFIAQRP